MILVGDVGATKTVLQLLERGPGGTRPALERRYEDAQFSEFGALVRAFIDEARGQGLDATRIDIAVLGIAAPVTAERVRLTNRSWEIDAPALCAEFGIGRVRLVNDFAAAASGIALLAPADLVTLQPGEPVGRAPRVVIGAGTGLGVAYLVWQQDRYEVVAGEGGNAGFAPATLLQAQLWQHLHGRSGHVGVEQVVSGPGLANIYRFLRETDPDAGSAALARAMDEGDGAAAIARFALECGDPLAGRALDLFIEAYGAVAGDHALAVLARGGVFIAGGIAPKILRRLGAGGFVTHFCRKGKFAWLASRIPVHVVVNERLGLLGAVAIARQGDDRPQSA